MQYPDTPPSHEPPAPARARHPMLGRITWRALWVVPATGWVLTLPESPAKWPALTLLMASALVLHADSIARPIRRRLGSRI